MDTQAKKDAQAHVSIRTYLWIGLFLTAMTAIEVALPFAPLQKSMMRALLLVLGAIKFGTVAAYFMHLKFDRRLLIWVFGAGMALALFVTVAMSIVMAA